MRFIAFTVTLFVSASLSAFANETVQLKGSIKTHLAESAKCNYAFRYLEGRTGRSVGPNGKLHWLGVISFDPLISSESELPAGGLDLSKATSTLLPTAVRGCKVLKSDGQITGAGSDRVFVWLEGKNCNALTEPLNNNQALQLTFEWKNVLSIDGKDPKKNVSLTLESEAQLCD